MGRTRLTARSLQVDTRRAGICIAFVSALVRYQRTHNCGEIDGRAQGCQMDACRTSAWTLATVDVRNDRIRSFKVLRRVVMMETHNMLLMEYSNFVGQHLTRGSWIGFIKLTNSATSFDEPAVSCQLSCAIIQRDPFSQQIPFF